MTISIPASTLETGERAVPSRSTPELLLAVHTGFPYPLHQQLYAQFCAPLLCISNYNEPKR